MLSRRSPDWSAVYARAALGGFLVLAVYSLSSSRAPFFDEVPYLALARSLAGSESFQGWLLQNDKGPTGPVHALLHYTLSGGTGTLAAPWFRLPNILLLGVVVVVLAHSLRQLGSTPSPWAVAGAVMAVPMTWLMAGLALTEIPAMVGMTLAAWAAITLGSASTVGVRRPWGWWLVLAIGVVIGVCGRQTYLVTMPALLIYASRSLRDGFRAALAVTIGLLPACWLFATWGGLVPPRLAFVGGLKLAHAIMAFGYAGIVTLLVAPRFIGAHARCAIIVAVLAVAVNVFTHTIHFTMLTSAQRFLPSPGLGRLLEMIASHCFLAAGAAFVAAVGRELWTGRDRYFAGHAVAVLLLCAACAGMTFQFSSRYVGMTLPFLVMLLARWLEFTPWGVARLLLGMGLGAASLLSYYRFVG